MKAKTQNRAQNLKPNLEQKQKHNTKTKPILAPRYRPLLWSRSSSPLVMHMGRLPGTNLFRDIKTYPGKGQPHLLPFAAVPFCSLVACWLD